MTIESALSWRSYSVSKRDKAKLFNFILRGLEARGCIILNRSPDGVAPFFVSYETPSGVRCSVLAYAFYANSKLIKNRPDDEHRFQIKYGGNLKSSLEVAIQPDAVITTIFLGINPEDGYFVAADPKLNNPSPMSRSIEFKDHNVASILKHGWATWERDRRPPKAKDRPAFDPGEFDVRTEVLVGGTRDRIFDLITLEQIAYGLDPGERHLAADKLQRDLAASTALTKPHDLLDELGVDETALFDLIQGAGRLKMAVRGWVAEHHLERILREVPGVSECQRLDEEGKPDISLRWKGSAPILIECKNTLRQTYANGDPKVDFQRTRAAKNNPGSRYYRPGDFPILAACLHPIREAWEFEYALTDTLPKHDKYPDRIANNLRVESSNFSADIASVLEAHIAKVAGGS